MVHTTSSSVVTGYVCTVRRVVRVQASSNKQTDFDFDAALASVADKARVDCV